jgi:Flp pilus assembly protein TadB
MMRIHIQRRYGANASTASKVLAVVLVVVALACAVLLILGLWILLAIAVCTMAIVALVRALLPRGRARNRTAKGHVVIEGHATTLREPDEASGKERAS